MNTLLALLDIFENYTDNQHMLSKMEILEMLSNEGIEIEEKQFYRKIEELRDNGYAIEIKKSRTTYYYLQRDRLTKEEWLYLVTLILGNEDLTSKETNHILKSLEAMSVSYNSLQFANQHKNKVVSKKSPYSRLNNFSVILQAIEQGALVHCKQAMPNGESYQFSELITLKPVQFAVESNCIYILVMQDNQKVKYALNSLIDVEII